MKKREMTVLVLLLFAIVLLMFVGCEKATKKGTRTSGESRSDLESTELTLKEDGTYEVKRFLVDKEEVILPDTVDGVPITSIGEYAFMNCSSLSSVTLPGSLTFIGEGAFFNCKNITCVYYQGDIASWCRIRYDSDAIYDDNPLYVAHNLYIRNTLVEDLVIPETVTEIEDFAFAGWGGKRLVVPKSVTKIGRRAFYQCPYLTEITFGEAEMGKGAFGNCYQLKKVYYTDDIVSWCNLTFDWESSNPLTYAHDLYINGTLIKELTFPDAVTEIKNNAFCGWSGEKAVFSDSTTTIGKQAFKGCEELTAVVMGRDMNFIDEAAFCYCRKLSSLAISSGMKKIKGDAFIGCEKLACIDYSGDIVAWCSIDYSGGRAEGYTPLYYAQELLIGGERLTEIVLPETVTEINDYAFRGWNGTGITLPETLRGIGKLAFSECKNLVNITVPNSVSTIGIGAFSGCSELTSITLPENLTSVSARTFNECDKLSKVTIPERVTEIGDYAFGHCSHLTEIVLPEGMTEIKKGVFYGTGLMAIDIPDSVTSIGKNAFCRCVGLTSIVIPEKVTSLGELAFGGCYNLTQITLPKSLQSIEAFIFDGCKSLTSIVVPEDVTSVGECAFKQCENLTSITLPAGLKRLDGDIFYGCKKMVDIFYNGTMKQWEAIDKSGAWYYGFEGEVVHCADGDVRL